MKVNKFKACTNCRFLTDGDKCPLCGSTDLTINWQDAILVVDSNSKMAKLAKIDKEGIFAVFIK
ncbi:MAG: transcription elongation factor subunit Spt4 [Nanoarchaeota archaeon]